MRFGIVLVRSAFLLAIVLLIGCAGPTNPSFDVSPSQARDELIEMRSSPVRLRRPIVIVGGYHDIGIGPWMLGSKLLPALGSQAEDRITYVAVGYETSFARCRRQLVAAVDRAFGKPDVPDASAEESIDETVEVDVVAFSMGGIVARDAALPRPGERRLKIARLFTISTPHAGARWADELPPVTHSVDSRIADMQSTSAFLERLNQAYREERECSGSNQGIDDEHYRDVWYPIVAYVRLGDTVVGPENAAPPGETPFWVSNPILQPAHIGASVDSRIIADIARRLRYEKPLTDARPTPLPASATASAGG